MEQLIIAIYKFLSSTPVNFWFWLLWVVPPVLVLCIGPEKSYKLRVGRLILAIGLSYVFLNLSIGTEYDHAWKAYYKCQENSIHREMSPEMQAECGPILEERNDTRALFAFMFGYILTAGYVGFWELIWRIWYRKKIKSLGKKYKGRWLSNTTIGIFLLWMLCFLGLVITLIIFSITHS